MALYLLYEQLGVSCIVTVICLLLLIPVNMWLMKLSGAMLKAAMAYSDERTKLEGELVGGEFQGLLILTNLKAHPYISQASKL